MEKTPAATLEASSETYVPKYFKAKIKNVCHTSKVNKYSVFIKVNIQYFLLIELSLDVCICSHMYLSQVQQNVLLERSWNGYDLVL